MKRKTQTLRAQAVPQAVWHFYRDARTGTQVPAIGSLRYWRFHQRVRLNECVIHPRGAGWGIKDGRALPPEVEFHVWDDAARAWAIVRTKEGRRPLPGNSHSIQIDGVETRYIKAICLRHHPVPPHSGEQWANPRNVPYGALDGVEWRGQTLTPWQCDLPIQPHLAIRRNRPKAPQGMTMFAESDQVRFSSSRFSVGFSLRRPLLTHLCWDSAAGGKVADNMLFHRTMVGDLGASGFGDSRIFSGPLWNTLDWDCNSRLWGGEVSVNGNLVSYRNLHADEAVVVDADFEIRPDGMNLRLAQRTRSEHATLECDAWRFVWDGRTAAVATLGLPRQDEGRTGAVGLPAVWAAPGYGNLSCQQIGGDPCRLQVDSMRWAEMGWAGIIFGQPGSYPHHFVLGEHRREARFDLRVCQIGPRKVTGYHPELSRNWGPGLMFRAELSGFSNNALSTNCHLSQTGVTDLAAYTPTPRVGPPPIELARYTATMALKDGRGYGDCRELYQDSDPSILNMTGRIHQVAPNADWLADVWPFIRRATERILSKVDRRGLVVAPLATGNLGDTPTITNGWDTINFGHYDAYSNVETYRAFRNVLALAQAAGDGTFARRVRHAADQMRRGFAPCFYNPKTGWFGSWRSQDGELHDYGMLCINGPACLYGLVPPARARRILERMERTRLELGMTNFRYGLPSALLPVRRGDHMEGKIGWPFRDDGADSFGIFCNGTASLGLAYYYVRAMTVFGFKKVADQMSREILEGHALGRLVGGVGTGVEFHTHEGIVCGYEGAYVQQFPALLAVAQHLGLVTTLQPEFWPEFH